MGNRPVGKRHENQTSGKKTWVTDQWEKTLGNRPKGKKTWVTDNDHNLHVYTVCIRTIYKKNKKFYTKIIQNREY